MNIVTIPRKMVGEDDLIVIQRKEYEQMKARMFPMVNLSGKKAAILDRRVDKALRDYRQNKTKKISTLAELD